MTEHSAESIAFADRKLKQAIALSELTAVGCHSCVELFRYQIEPHLKINEDGSVSVVDPKGEVRHGVTPRMLALQTRAEFDAESPGRFFKK